jgi:site-specific DNA-methyltransferase (adenine-specific)
MGGMMELKGFYNMDCMEGMKQIPDNYFDLAIVDPPYGIGEDVDKIRDYNSKSCESWKGRKPKKYIKKQWDNCRPTIEYFRELQRVSKNQIIWGGNYFADLLKPTGSWIVWDKQVVMPTFSDGELAWCSYKNSVKFARFLWAGYRKCEETKRFHPTQKPIALYKWLLKNYAKEGDKILDTHVGSASSLIACYDLGFEYLGFELDEDYFKEATKRLEAHKSQLNLFLDC